MKTAAKRLTAVDIRRGKSYTSPMYRLLIQLVLATMLAWPLTAMATEEYARQTGRECAACCGTAGDGRLPRGTAPRTGLFFDGLHEPGNRLLDRADPGALALVVETWESGR